MVEVRGSNGAFYKVPGARGLSRAGPQGREWGLGREEEEAAAVAAPPPRSEGKRGPRGRKERRRRSGAGVEASAGLSRCLGRGSRASGLREAGGCRNSRPDEGEREDGRGLGGRGGLGPSPIVGRPWRCRWERRRGQESPGPPSPRR